MVLLLSVYIAKLYPLKDNTSTCALFRGGNSPGSYFTSLPDDPKKSLFTHMASSYASLFVTQSLYTFVWGSNMAAISKWWTWHHAFLSHNGDEQIA